jgi:pyruvate formate lyase activating enzyme
MQLAEVLLRDRAFYRHSGGGVTLSGGECALYPDYLELLLRALKQHDIHVVLETAGLFDYRLFEQKVLPHLDAVYYDIKFADSGEHERLLGAPNHRILTNFRRLVASGRVAVHPRIPIIPAITDTRENLAAIAEIISSAGARDVSLVPYNPMGLEMFDSLGRPRPPLPATFMKPDEEAAVHAMFEEILDGLRPVAA